MDFNYYLATIPSKRARIMEARVAGTRVLGALSSVRGHR